MLVKLVIYKKKWSHNKNCRGFRFCSIKWSNKTIKEHLKFHLMIWIPIKIIRLRTKRNLILHKINLWYLNLIIPFKVVNKLDKAVKPTKVVSTLNTRILFKTWNKTKICFYLCKVKKTKRIDGNILCLFWI